MARGLRRGPVLLRFRSLVDSVAHYVAGIVDARQLSKVRYTLRDCYLSGLALFSSKTRRCCSSNVAFSANSKPTTCPPPSASLGSLATPSSRDLIDRHDYAPMLPCFADFIGRLQRFKWLQHYQMFDARYLITLDGSRYFSSELVGCERCLSTTKDGIEYHHHDILQAAIVHPDKRVVLPLAPEFIRNSDGKGDEYHKQDCEINAGYRMLQRLRSDYPRMRQLSWPTVFTPSKPFVEKLTAGRFSFLLVAKPGDHKSLYQDVDGLRRGNLLDRHHTVHRGERREYELGHRSAAERQSDSRASTSSSFGSSRDSGKVNYRNAWVTDLVPTTDNIAQLVRAARARWKIENEAFNTLKNQGYHLKHNFGHGDRHLSEAFFTLNLLAFFMHQNLRAGRWPVSARAHLLQFPPRVLGRGAVRFPAVPVYLVGPGAGAHELAAGATAALSVSVVHGPHRWIYASGRPRADSCAP